MSTDDSAAASDESDSPGEGFANLRAQLRNLPRRTAPSSFEADLERRLTSQSAGAPIVRMLRMRPFLAAMTTLGGILLVLSFLLFPGRMDTTRSSAVSPAPEAAKARIHARTDTADGDSLARVKKVSTTVP